MDKLYYDGVVDEIYGAGWASLPRKENTMVVLQFKSGLKYITGTTYKDTGAFTSDIDLDKALKWENIGELVNFLRQLPEYHHTSDLNVLRVRRVTNPTFKIVGELE